MIDGKEYCEQLPGLPSGPLVYGRNPWNLSGSFTVPYRIRRLAQMAYEPTHSFCVSGVDSGIDSVGNKLPRMERMLIKPVTEFN